MFSLWVFLIHPWRASYCIFQTSSTPLSDHKQASSITHKTPSICFSPEQKLHTFHEREMTHALKGTHSHPYLISSPMYRDQIFHEINRFIYIKGHFLRSAGNIFPNLYQGIFNVFCLWFDHAPMKHQNPSAIQIHKTNPGRDNI